MFARASAFVIWSLVAAAAVFWLLRFAVAAPQAPAYAVPVGQAAALHGDLARVFGAAPVVTAAAEVREAPSRFRLLGVMAPRASVAAADGPYGVALIAVDGKPAKAFVVGAPLERDLVLQSVGLRTAQLSGPGGAGALTLALPALPAAATGVLSLPGAGASIGAPVPPMVPVMSGPLPATAPAPMLQPGVSQPAIVQAPGAAPPAFEPARSQ